MQMVINSIIAGAGIALVAIGFSLIYSICRFFHFAYGAIYTVGGYMAYMFVVLCGWSWFVAIPLAIILAVVVGCLGEMCIYRPLRKRCASSMVLLLASLGLFVVLQNLISICFGNGSKVLLSGDVHPGLVFFGARITPIQLALLTTSFLVALGLSALLRLTKTGKAIRAVANDPVLANSIGIRVDHSILCVFAIGSMLATVAAIMMACDTNLDPMMGFHALLLGIVAAIVGGIGSVNGALLGGFLVGAAQNIGVWKLPTQWQDTIVFIILLLFLLLRPQGVFGRPLQASTT